MICRVGSAATLICSWPRQLFWACGRPLLTWNAQGARFVEADILTVEQFPHAQQIYHLACPASPPFYQRDPVRTWKISVIGTMRVAEWALKIGARIVFTSTSEVYGDPLEHPRALMAWCVTRAHRAPILPCRARVVLGQREPRGHPLVLRRGQARCGNAAHGHVEVARARLSCADLRGSTAHHVAGTRSTRSMWASRACSTRMARSWTPR